ncbi:hypothetical protein ACU686_41575 [Yinghuangia aomiensis]
MSGTTTRVPGGSDAATGASRPDTFAPIVMSATSAPTSAAKDPRATSPASPQTSQLVCPVRQSRCAARTAS